MPRITIIILSEPSLIFPHLVPEYFSTAIGFLRSQTANSVSLASKREAPNPTRLGWVAGYFGMIFSRTLSNRKCAKGRGSIPPHFNNYFWLDWKLSAIIIPSTKLKVPVGIVPWQLKIGGSTGNWHTNLWLPSVGKIFKEGKIKSFLTSEQKLGK
jgi:hypothetical protein